MVAALDLDFSLQCDSAGRHYYNHIDWSRRPGIGEYQLLSMYEDGPGEVRSIYGQTVLTQKEILKHAKDFLLASTQNERISLGWKSAPIAGICEAKVCPVLEPLKCRLITKGSGLPYAAAAPAQKQMWHQIVSIPACALVGETLNASHLARVAEQGDALGAGLDWWASGDYSAATDGLSAEISRLCFDQWLARAGATPDEERVWRAVIGNHHISYPAEFASVTPELSPFLQSNGQLMGSPLSFPILCAINLVSYWHSLECYLGRKVDLTELPVLINGDDIVFRTNPRHYEEWQRWIHICGFTLSPGKNYLSKDFVTLNSEFFLWKKQVRGNGFKLIQIPSLNTGLLLEHAQGPLKVPQRPCNQEQPIHHKINRAIEESCSPGRTQRRVRHYFRRQISRLTGNGEFSLTAALELGGVGLSSTGLASGDAYYTSFQRKLASHLLKGIRDLEGTECRSTEPPTLSGSTRFVDESSDAATIPRHRGPIRQVRISPALQPCREFEERFEEGRPVIPIWSDRYLSSGQKPDWRMRGVTTKDLRAFRKALPNIPVGLSDPGRFDLEVRHMPLVGRPPGL